MLKTWRQLVKWLPFHGESLPGAKQRQKYLVKWLLFCKGLTSSKGSMPKTRVPNRAPTTGDGEASWQGRALIPGREAGNGYFPPW